MQLRSHVLLVRVCCIAVGAEDIGRLQNPPSLLLLLLLLLLPDACAAPE
jgi:hypothetical protein